MNPVFFHGDDIAMGGLFIVTGIYGFAVLYFTSNKPVSTVLTNKQYRWIFGSLMAIGLFLVALHFVPD